MCAGDEADSDMFGHIWRWVEKGHRDQFIRSGGVLFLIYLKGLFIKLRIYFKKRCHPTRKEITGVWKEAVGSKNNLFGGMVNFMYDPLSGFLFQAYYGPNCVPLAQIYKLNPQPPQ